MRGATAVALALDHMRKGLVGPAAMARLALATNLVRAASL